MLKTKEHFEQEEKEYFFILKLFNEDYYLLVKAIKELCKSKNRPKEILKVIEDIRFTDTENRQANYHKIKNDIEKLLDLKMDTIRNWKQNKSGSLFGDSEEGYTDELFKESNR